jgi:mono/diheme cytochrome c family protein
VQFPTFQVPWFGNGMTIGFNAVVHVLISHGIAIGAFAMILLAEWFDLQGFGRNAAEWNRFNKRLLKFSVIVVSVVGSVTGAGIWFTTMALASRGIGSMLRLFFWPWFTEWGVFVLEIGSLLLLYYYWDRLARHRRIRLALVAAYLVTALFSAILIVGIIGFMLTSGTWPAERTLASAFFNPSLAPQLLARLSLSIVIGALLAIAFLYLSSGDRRFLREALPPFGTALAASLAVFAISLLWYSAVVPRGFTARPILAVLTTQHLATPWFSTLTVSIGGGLLIVLAISAMSGRTEVSRWLVIPGILVFAGAVTGFERLREFSRFPYLMPGYMYANGVLQEEEILFRRGGALQNTYWFRQDEPSENVDAAGAFLFSQNCASCHTLGGSYDIYEMVEGRSEDGLFVILGHTHPMVPFMPPFHSTEEERRALARYLYRLSQDEVRFESYARLIPADGDS